MKPLLLAIAATFALAGTARAQEPKAHEHEHAQPPAVAGQKADEPGEHHEMCACCKDGGMAAMQEKMKEMMGKMKETAKEKK